MYRALLLSIVTFTGTLLTAQDEAKDQVALALKTGNSRELAKHFIANIDLTLPGSSEVYSKAQAEQILRKFFEEHAPEDLTIEHEGVSKMGDSYYIGKLVTNKGEFRVTFFLKKAGAVHLVKQLRIETGKAICEAVLPEGTHTLIRLALQEDIGTGDHTTLACIPEGKRGAARLLVKQEGVLAGLELAEAICEAVDPQLHRRMLMQDGAYVRPGDVAFTVTGQARSILMAERVLLNFMQRMSGIATLTRKYVDAVQGTGCRVLDTRKTTPTLRALEKWAVRIGGGHNHRHGLYDMLLIKDNHIDMAGGIAQAIHAANYHLETEGLSLPIEIECRNLKELELVVLAGGVHRIMFDNFELEDLRRAVHRVDRKYETEASGGITLQTAGAIAKTGVDFISVGAITHSAPSLDLSLKAM